MTDAPCVGIDPGVRALGWARSGHARRLTLAGCSVLPDTYARSGVRECAVGHLRAIRFVTGLGWGNHAVTYLESMTAVRDRATTPQDLIDVQTVGCLVASEIAGSADALCLLTPATWKGSNPKEVHWKRWIGTDAKPGALAASERLTLREALEQCPKKHHKEILDAVGILLYGLGRIERNGTPRKAGA